MHALPRDLRFQRPGCTFSPPQSPASANWVSCAPRENKLNDKPRAGTARTFFRRGGCRCREPCAEPRGRAIASATPSRNPSPPRATGDDPHAALTRPAAWQRASGGPAGGARGTLSPARCSCWPDYLPRAGSGGRRRRARRPARVGCPTLCPSFSVRRTASEPSRGSSRSANCLSLFLRRSPCNCPTVSDRHKLLAYVTCGKMAIAASDNVQGRPNGDRREGFDVARLGCARRSSRRRHSSGSVDVLNVSVAQLRRRAGD
ncbi:hypothetical protein PsYK624_108600 [Phanerochaete sordida]|uniref:Uncharacterized protein n=1 Tax=Phanerochaete sordida TaxID=48140 RepID=A0A9P3LHI0_9APHY|nr:hypothetical protein PsYK624_108600 [Phanerochaete sordida]